MDPKPVQFFQSLTLQVGARLMGQARWPVKVQLVRLTIQATSVTLDPNVTFDPNVTLDPTGDVRTTLALELNGVLSEYRFDLVALAGQTGSIERTIRNLAINIPADTELRLRCVDVSGPDGLIATAENGLCNWLVTIWYQPAGADVRPAPEFTVAWVNGPERTVLYNYDPETLEFVPARAGVTNGKASIEGGVNFKVRFLNSGTPQLAMQATPQGIRVNRLIQNGNTATVNSPRLEFRIGETRVASLTREGELRVNHALEPDNGFFGISSGLDRFGFAANGMLRGTLGLGANGMRAGWFLEPVETDEQPLMLVNGQLLLFSTDGNWYWVSLKQAAGKPHLYVNPVAATPPPDGTAEVLYLNGPDGLTYPVGLKDGPHLKVGPDSIPSGPGFPEGIQSIILKSDDDTYHPVVVQLAALPVEPFLKVITDAPVLFDNGRVLLYADDGQWYYVSLKQTAGKPHFFVDPVPATPPGLAAPAVLLLASNGLTYPVRLAVESGGPHLKIGPLPVVGDSVASITLKSDDGEEYLVKAYLRLGKPYLKISAAAA